MAYRSVKGEPHTVFDGLNLNIRKGEKVALIGSNGAGKSTLMKLMVGLLKPNSGTVSLFEEAIGDKKAEDLSRQISLVYQNPEEMFIKDSIRADIAYAMEVRNVPEWEKRTGELLERFRLTELADRDGRLMSGGQMRRASLAIGIALNPGILLLDEPTANLDIATRREIMAVLDDMKDIIQTAVIATHDMQLVCQWAERIVVLCGGKVVADGPRDTVFSHREVTRLVGIRPPEIFTMAQALDQRALCYTVEEFLDRFQILLVRRDEEEPETVLRAHPFLSQYQDRFCIMPAPDGLEGISSSAVREKLRNGEPGAEEMLHPVVWQLLQENGGVKR